MKIILSIVSYLLFQSVSYATLMPDTLDVSRIKSIALGAEMLYFEDSSISLTPQQIISKFYIGEGIKPKSPNPNFGIANSTYWAFLTLKNSGNEPVNIFINVDNVLMDTTRCFEIKDSTNIELIGEAGDYLPFNIRPVYNRNILYPVNFQSNESKSFLISVFKDQSSISLPIKVWNRDAFYDHELKETLLYGLYFGTMLLILLYSFFLFVNIRKKFVLFYFLYVAFLSLFQLTHLGFAFQYLWPNSIFLSNYGFWMMGVMMTVFFIFFARSFTKLKQVSPLLDYYFKVISYFLIAFMVVIYLAPDAWLPFTSIAKKLYYYVQMTSAIGFIAMAIVMLKKGSVEGKYFALAFGVLLAFGMVYILREVGIAPYNGFTQNALILGSLIEVLIFSLGITYMVNSAFKEKQKLAEKLQEQQEALMISTIETEERERQRISSELHDSIGSQLSFLKVSLEQAQINSDLVEQVDGLADTIRKISHDMTPIVLQMDGIKSAIVNLVEKLNVSSKTKFKLEWLDFPNDIEDIQAVTVYRIVQEASNNIIKHSNANEAFFQFTGYPNEIVIVLEDDGVGYEILQHQGIGLKNMNNRVSQLKGTIDISSSLGNGTSIVISFPG